MEGRERERERERERDRERNDPRLGANTPVLYRVFQFTDLSSSPSLSLSLSLSLSDLCSPLLIERYRAARRALPIRVS